MANYSTDSSGSALDNLAQVSLKIYPMFQPIQINIFFEHSLIKATDLSRVEASEEEKIKAMMTQSTQDYDPSK